MGTLGPTGPAGLRADAGGQLLGSGGLAGDEDQFEAGTVRGSPFHPDDLQAAFGQRLGCCWPFAQYAVQRILVAGWFVGEAAEQPDVVVPGGAE